MTAGESSDSSGNRHDGVIDARAGTAQNSPMSSGFETGKVLVAGVRANEKFHFPKAHRCDGLGDALVYDFYALTPAEIKIVEGV